MYFKRQIFTTSQLNAKRRKNISPGDDLYTCECVDLLSVVTYVCTYLYVFLYVLTLTTEPYESVFLVCVCRRSLVLHDRDRQGVLDDTKICLPLLLISIGPAPHHAMLLHYL